MVVRPTLLAASLILMLVSVEAVGQTRQGTSNGRPSHRGPSDSAIKVDAGSNVDEMIRSADRLLDRLEARPKLAPDDPDLRKVNQDIDRIRSSDESNAYLLFLRARFLVLARRPADASIKLLEFVEKQQGQSEWRAFRLLGDLFLDEFPRLAKSNYKKAAVLIPFEPSVLYGLSVCEMKLGALKESVRLAREAVRADGRLTIRYVFHLAEALRADKQLDEALREAEFALKLAQDESAENPDERDQLLLIDGQYGLLTSILRSRIADPETAGVNDFLRLSTCVRQRIRVTEKLALHELLDVIAAGVQGSEPNTPLALLQQYAILLSDVGRIGKAIEVVERVVQLDPDNADAEALLGRLRKFSRAEPKK